MFLRGTGLDAVLLPLFTLAGRAGFEPDKQPQADSGTVPHYAHLPKIERCLIGTASEALTDHLPKVEGSSGRLLLRAQPTLSLAGVHCLMAQAKAKKFPRPFPSGMP